MPLTVQLRYSVTSCSEYSGLYTADNILYDRPHDQASRWSSGKDNATLGHSWLLLELETPCVLENVTFGKFHKVHPCNMKDFEIQIGMSRDYMTSVLHSALKNDSKPETFPIRNKSKDGVLLPSKFVEILALSAHGNNFNTSIWHVSLSGKVEKNYVQKVVDEYERNREALAMRHILKHLRQRRHLNSYRQLLTRSGVQLEHSLVSELYDALVIRGDWDRVEQQLRTLARAGLFEDFILACVPRARWRRLRGTDANGDTPSKRGGHAMCMDVEQGLIYLFGGYDGRKSLDDFWVYNVREDRWRFISHSSSVEEKNGPGPRACHKMIFDSKSGYIYLLGRLGDSDFQTVPENGSTSASAMRERLTPAWVEGPTRRRSVGVGTSTASGTDAQAPPNQSEATSSSARPAPSHDYFSELHRYRTRGFDEGKWELLNHDTGGIGGPKLIYDHQLALDSETQTLYVHGGRVVDGDWNTPKFSGMYSYDLRSGKWTNILTTSADSSFSPRFGHSMLLEPNEKKLFIFAGQKDDYLSDMWEFDITTKMMTERFQNVASIGGPEACFAQRAVIDSSLQEIYVFAGLTRRNLQSSQGLSVSLLKYDTFPGTWMRVPVAEQHCPTQPHPHPPTSSSQRSHHSLKRQRSEDEGTDDGCDSGSDKAEHCSSNDDGEPVARCACQVVYDPFSKTFYLFGGNAGLTRRDTVGTEAPEAEERLDDFWSMKLERPSHDEIIRRAIFETRTQHFKEMCEDASPVSALSFLQNDVSAVVNHADHDEAAEFRSLLSHLFARPPAETPTIAAREPPMASGGGQGTAFASRSGDMAPTDPGTPVSDSGSSGSGSGSGEWTCELRNSSNVPRNEDAHMSDASMQASEPRAQRSNTFQPQAHRSREGDSFSETAMETETNGPREFSLRGVDKPLSDARFIQRTAVFEGLLRFVSNKGYMKQPDGLLVDLLSSLE